MKIEFTQWLQAALERFAEEKTEKLIKERYPNHEDEGRCIYVTFKEGDDYGDVSVSWSARRQGDGLYDHEGTENFEIRDLLREYIKE